MVLPLEADLHGEGEHHVDRVDPVHVEDVDPLLDDDRPLLDAAAAPADVGRGRVLEVGLGHDHLEISRKLQDGIRERNDRHLH